MGVWDTERKTQIPSFDPHEELLSRVNFLIVPAGNLLPYRVLDDSVVTCMIII